MAKKTLGVNPWATIWTKPRDTIKRIVRYNPKHRFVWLSFLYGFPMLLHTAQNLNLGDTYTTAGIVVVALVLGTFAGMLGIVIASGLIYWTGKWIGGKDNYQNVRSAVAWSNVPNIIAVIAWAVLLYKFQGQLFFEDFEDKNFVGSDMLLVGGATFVQAVISIWSFVILVKGLGEVQGFSAWKGVLNVLIPFFMVGAAIWVISWIFYMGFGVTGAQ
ncbi:MAG: hypothetical protein S4CHLAM123_08420 [Chlamydiales bacterium]|nr:hypothetical protein [Chlamydiales bacterium]